MRSSTESPLLRQELKVEGKRRSVLEAQKTQSRLEENQGFHDCAVAGTDFVREIDKGLPQALIDLKQARRGV